jgi:hypothetical protein
VKNWQVTGKQAGFYFVLLLHYRHSLCSSFTKVLGFRC